jgi:DNA-binding MarR family transcriptional regulator
MVVYHRRARSDEADRPTVVPANLDLAYLGFFLGLRVNELVAEDLVAAGFKDVRQSHGYVVQHLIAQDRTITELARRMEVSQQAASKVVAEMKALGILESVPGDDRRAKLIRLSARGRDAVTQTRQARRRIEARLIRAIGVRKYSEGKRVLIACLDTLGGLGRISSRRIRPPR